MYAWFREKWNYYLIIFLLLTFIVWHQGWPEFSQRRKTYVKKYSLCRCHPCMFPKISFLDGILCIKRTLTLIATRSCTKSKRPWYKILYQIYYMREWSINLVLICTFFCIFHYGSVGFFRFWNCSIQWKYFTYLVYFWKSSKIIFKLTNKRM